jgi:hypothetical protein
MAIFAADPETEEFKKRQKELERLNSAIAGVAQRMDASPRFEHPDRSYVLAKAVERFGGNEARGPLYPVRTPSGQRSLQAEPSPCILEAFTESTCSRWLTDR